MNLDNEGTPVVRPKTPLPKSKKQPYFIRDVAQERTLSQWRKQQAVVSVRLATGDSLEGTISEIGVFTVYLKTLDVDVCLFKTGIVYVSGPKTVEAERGIVTEIAEEGKLPAKVDDAVHADSAA